MDRARPFLPPNTVAVAHMIPAVHRWHRDVRLSICCCGFILPYFLRGGCEHARNAHDGKPVRDARSAGAGHALHLALGENAETLALPAVPPPG